MARMIWVGGGIPLGRRESQCQVVRPEQVQPSGREGGGRAERKYWEFGKAIKDRPE